MGIRVPTQEEAERIEAEWQGWLTLFLRDYAQEQAETRIALATEVAAPADAMDPSRNALKLLRASPGGTLTITLLRKVFQLERRVMELESLLAADPDPEVGGFADHGDDPGRDGDGFG